MRRSPLCGLRRSGVPRSGVRRHHRAPPQARVGRRGSTGWHEPGLPLPRNNALVDVCIAATFSAAIRQYSAVAYGAFPSIGTTGVPSQPCCLISPRPDTLGWCTSTVSCSRWPSGDVQAVAVDARDSLNAGYRKGARHTVPPSEVVAVIDKFTRRSCLKPGRNTGTSRLRCGSHLTQ